MKSPAAENMSRKTLVVVCLFGAGCWLLFGRMVYEMWKWVQG